MTPSRRISSGSGVSRFGFDQLDEAVVLHVPLAARREDDVSGAKTGGVGRLAGIHRSDLRIQDRSDPDVAHVVLALADGRHLLLQPGAVPVDVQRDLASGLGCDGHQEVFPIIDAFTVHGPDMVTELQPGLFGYRALDNETDHGRMLVVGRNRRALIQDHGHHGQRQHHVHHRSHDQHLEPLPLGLGQELVIGPGASIFGVLARHLDVAAKGDRADAILGVAAFELQDLGAESQGERQHAHADAAGHHEVPELVHEDEHAQHENEGQKCLQENFPVSEPCDRGFGTPGWRRGSELS